VVNVQFHERMLGPALQGIYAGDVERMSATLTLSTILRGAKKGRKRGSVAPKQGMGELIAALTAALKERGVEIEYGTDYKIPEKLEQPTVICTSAWAAAEVVGAHDPALAEALARCESLPLVTVTAFFPPHPKDLKGFGCLFPESQGFNALGVLFNDCIFAGRSSHRSETWILGGAKNRGVVELGDAELKKTILTDRARLTANPQEPLAMHITRRPKAFPHYTVEWEDRLRHLKVNRPLFLHGNYLGQLGLARIHARSKALAAHLKDLYVS
jgi:oxygen-dependent protoporphyrinogen oxidase